VDEMTDRELIEALQRVLRERRGGEGLDKQGQETRDLAKFDRIVGLLKRHGGVSDEREVA
jgi:hypothetical protein